jgi:hypothetical protein
LVSGAAIKNIDITFNSGAFILKKTFIIFFLLLLTSAGSMQAGQAASNGNSESPEAVVSSFYQWYMHVLNQNKDPFSQRRTALRRYVSLRLIREIDRMVKGPDGLDGDYFLDAQDFDKEWEKNITVSPAQVNGKQATTTVKLVGPQVGNRTLQISLRQEGGKWKIDRVKNLE